jgi:hypothetical protein
MFPPWQELVCSFAEQEQWMVLSFWSDEFYRSLIKTTRFIGTDFLEMLADLVCSS